MPEVPAPPVFADTAAYAATLTDASFWRSYCLAALDQHGMDAGELRAGFAGTYPVLLSGAVVVKLFGHFGAWHRSYGAELAALRAITSDQAVAAPAVLATGSLYPTRAESWPYLVLERIEGVAWRDAAMNFVIGQRVAADLGRQLRRVHRSVVDPGAVHPDWLAGHARSTTARYRAWRTLPDHLIAQIDEYLRDYRPGRRCLVHADVTADHVFVEGDRFTGLIDWGDAMITDPFYELAALHLGTFRADPDLLRAFLQGYGWPVDATFARRAMQTALMHQFNVLSYVATQAGQAETLDQLAEQLWR